MNESWAHEARITARQLLGAGNNRAMTHSTLHERHERRRSFRFAWPFPGFKGLQCVSRSLRHPVSGLAPGHGRATITGFVRFDHRQGYRKASFLPITANRVVDRSETVRK